MNKTLPKGLMALLIVSLIGMVLVSCGPIFDIGDEIRGGNGGGSNNGNNGGGNGGSATGEPRPIPVPPDGYSAVKAYDWVDLVEYLQSDDTSYAITLTEMENTDIYLQRNISIIKPMRIIGSPGAMYTIHSISREGGSASYCLDLQADLELQYCGFTGYGGTSGTGNGIAADSPPLNIRDGNTLTMTGKDSVLELRDVGSGVEVRTGSQVKLGDGTGIVIADESGGLLFKAGVEKLIVSGNVSIKDKLTVGEGAILQIENGGELRIEPGATLTLDDSLKELRLDGDIVVDRTGSSVAALALAGTLTVDSLLGLISGVNGSLIIENGIPEISKPFDYGANTTVRLNSDGIYIGKRVSSELGGVVETSDDFTMPKGKKLAVGAGMDLNVKNKLTLEGSTLDVTGNVNVTGNGQIIVSAEDKFFATPKGAVVIVSGGTITIDDSGTFKDESVSQGAKSFTFPSYGAGALIVKDTGHAFMGADEVIGKSGPLQLSDAYSTLSVRTASGASEFRLKGNGTLTVPSGGFALGGRFVITDSSVLTVTGGTLAVSAPNQLAGTGTAAEEVQLIIGPGTKVAFYSTGNALLGEFEVGSYKWSGIPPAWNYH